MKVLIVSWLRNASAAQLTNAFMDAAADVEVVCPSLHPIMALNGVSRHHRYPRLRPHRALDQAIRLSAPDLIVPCDDIAVAHLNRLRADATTSGAQNHTADAINRSLGPSEAYPILNSRADLISLARQEGVPAPLTERVAGTDEVIQWLRRHGAPAYLKLDGTLSGEGVRKLETVDQAGSILAELASGPKLAKILRQTLWQRSLAGLKTRLGLVRPTVNIQAAINGRPANCSFVSWRGKVHALVGVEALRTVAPMGHATHVRLVDSQEMARAAEVLARRLNLTGFVGLDFVIEDATDRFWLIELNMRPTPISHFRLGAGRDLVGALLMAAGAERIEPKDYGYAERTVALFPYSVRSPSYGRGSGEEAQDLPLDQPRLVARYMTLMSHAHRLAGAVQRGLSLPADASA